MELDLMTFMTGVLSIVALDLLLGGDNAVVIAMAANGLPHELRKKAVLIGTGGAVVVRLIMTCLAVYLLTVPFLQAIGGLILLPIAVHLLAPAAKEAHVEAAHDLAGAVKTIILADAAMGIDNVVAIAGASHGHLILVVFGFLISIPIIVGGSAIIGRVLDRFPVLLYAGAALLGWTGGTMLLHDKIVGAFLTANFGTLAGTLVPALLAVLVCAVGHARKRRRAIV